MAPPVQRIRNIAVGLVVREEHALVEIYPATDRHGTFARAIGGGIDFLETAVQAVRREFEEELGVALVTAELLAITENIFEVDGRSGHEVVHVFVVTSPQLDDLDLADEIPLLDNHTIARWMPLEALRAGEPPFYPAGMAELASAQAAASRPRQA